MKFNKIESLICRGKSVNDILDFYFRIFRDVNKPQNWESILLHVWGRM